MNLTETIAYPSLKVIFFMSEPPYANWVYLMPLVGVLM